MNLKNFIGFLSVPFLRLANVKKGLSILIFHHVDDKLFNKFNSLITKLQDQMDFIDPLDLEILIKSKKKIKRKKVLLTFDDGFFSNYNIAKTFLKPLHIKALFFVNPVFIKCEKKSDIKRFVEDNLLNPDLFKLDPDIKPMNYSNLTDLLNDGHSIGSHTLSHQRLSGINSSESLAKEIRDSKLELEKKLNTTIDHFAYPFGDIDSISKEAIKIARSEYKFIYSGIRGLNSLKDKKSILFREPVDLNHSIHYNSFISSNGISLKDKKDRGILNKL